jgi:histidinol-phosphatase (PHP family)
LETLTDIRAIKDFDVLGHIDYIVRYGKEKEKYYSYTKFSDEIDEILKYLIAHGKGIELNTAGFKYGLGFCHPHPEILKRYCELGGEIITIGADGHKPEHIAYDFEKVAPILRECGFKYYTEFKERKPVFKQLP